MSGWWMMMVKVRHGGVELGGGEGRGGEQATIISLNGYDH